MSFFIEQLNELNAKIYILHIPSFDIQLKLMNYGTNKAIVKLKL